MAFSATLAWAQLPELPVQVDTARLEATENLSEGLANDLLELSVAVRDRDLRQVAEFFAPSIVTSPMPSQPGPPTSKVKWISTHGWAAATTGAPAGEAMGRDEYLKGWAGFLDHFSEIEDARFKVKAADIDDPTQAFAKARVAFFVIGRDGDGKREWARGTAMISARRAAEKEKWKIESLSLIGLESTLAETDLFSEICVPAGVDATLPAYGTPGNAGYVWRGAAAGDLDNDGFVDLFVTGATGNQLYLNDGHGKFKDVAAEVSAKLTLSAGSQPLIVDYDNDGDKDIFISAVGPQILLDNRLVPDGKLGFVDVSLEAHVDVSAVGFSAVAGDVNGDGYPDIYVASYNRYGLIQPDSWYRATNGTPNLLFVNQKNGSFREEAAKWGVDDHRWSYAAAFADVNGDGRQDLYVANDFGEKAMFINRGDRFVDEAKERGVLDPGNGMGAAFGDFNNDGLLDVHATNMSSTAGNRILARLFPLSSAKDNVLIKLAAGNDLFENTGDGHFRDVTSEVGGLSGGWAWGGGFIDFDNDGWEDLFTPNGFISGKSMKDT
jgi:hypothetical protein